MLNKNALREMNENIIYIYNNNNNNDNNDMKKLER